jgi:hypothetical protein
MRPSCAGLPSSLFFPTSFSCVLACVGNTAVVYMIHFEKERRRQKTAHGGRLASLRWWCWFGEVRGLRRTTFQPTVPLFFRRSFVGSRHGRRCGWVVRLRLYRRCRSGGGRGNWRDRDWCRWARRRTLSFQAAVAVEVCRVRLALQQLQRRCVRRCGLLQALVHAAPSLLLETLRRLYHTTNVVPVGVHVALLSGLIHLLCVLQTVEQLESVHHIILRFKAVVLHHRTVDSRGSTAGSISTVQATLTGNGCCRISLGRRTKQHQLPDQPLLLLLEWSAVL